MTRREALRDLIDTNLMYSPDVSKLRWILEANNWKDGQDVLKGASDEQVEAFFVVWGLDAYAC